MYIVDRKVGCNMSSPVLVVIGSRSFSDRGQLFRFLGGLGSFSELWSGGAPGADRLGELWARSVGLPFRCFPALWKRWGRSAGFRRSAELVSECPEGSLVVCFVDRPLESCRGSLFTVLLARRRGLGVVVVGPGESEIEQTFIDWDKLEAAS